MGRFWHVAAIREGFLFAEELPSLAGRERGRLIELCENDEVSLLLLVLLRVIRRRSFSTMAGGLGLPSGRGRVMVSWNLMGLRSECVQCILLLRCLLNAGKLPW